MASIKAIAAIALTLVVAVPILMGYAFASTEETSTYWQTDSTANATDLLLNAETEYYMDYYDPYNNAMLYQQYTAQGGTSYAISVPDYTTIGTNYTSLAEYSEGSQSVSLTSGTDYTYDGEGGSRHGWGDLSSEANHLIPNTAGIYATFTSSAMNAVHWTMQFDGEFYYGLSGAATTCYVDLVRDSGSTWTAYVTYDGDTTVYEGVSTWIIGTDADYDVDITCRGYTNIGIDGTISFSAPAYSGLVLTESDSTKHYVTVDSTTYVTKLASGYTTVGDDVYTNIDSITLVAPKSYSTLSVTYSTASGNYADPADGWAIAAPSGATSYYTWWMNGHLNQEVRLLVKFTGTDTCYLGPSTTTAVRQLVEIAYDGTGITVGDVVGGTDTYLGAYSSVLVVMTSTEATVYGISAWPTMGVYPDTFNEVTVDYTDLGADFAYISMGNSSSANTLYRVDYASIVAGTFPSTANYWFHLDDAYPERSLTFTFRSVATYGDWLTVGANGQDFTVTDGTITYTDTAGTSHTSKIRGMVLRFVYDSDSDDYEVAIDGNVIDDDGDAILYFGGEWSLTASASLISEQTSTYQTWAPGEFAFDKEDFAACGLLVAGACLIGLGMTGSRSGVKMGVLLMICGGAGLIYLTII